MFIGNWYGKIRFFEADRSISGFFQAILANEFPYRQPLYYTDAPRNDSLLKTLEAYSEWHNGQECFKNWLRDGRRKVLPEDASVGKLVRNITGFTVLLVLKVGSIGGGFLQCLTWGYRDFSPLSAYADHQRILGWSYAEVPGAGALVPPGTEAEEIL